MTEKLTKYFFHYRVMLALLGIIGASLILFSTSRYGADLPIDGVLYVVMARNMSNGHGATFNDSPVILHPPLYPAVLSILSRLLGIDPLLCVPILNALLFGMTVYLSGLLFHKCISLSPIAIILGVMFLLISRSLYLIFLMSLSEPLFICLVLIYLVAAEQYREKGNQSFAVLMALAAASASLTRYIGIILIPMGILSLLFFLRQRYAAIRWGHLLKFGLIATLPIAIWLIRNYAFSATWFGRRHSSQFTLSDNINFTVNTILSWYLPPKSIGYLGIYFYMGLIVFIVLGISSMKKRYEMRALINQMAPILLYVFIYVISLLMSSTRIAYDQIDNRLLSPIYVPLTLLCAFCVYQMYRLIQNGVLQRYAASIILIVLITGAGVYQAKSTLSTLMNHYETGGYGYNNKFWKSSETIHYLLSHESLFSECTVYSNVPMALQTVNIKARWLPARKAYNSTEQLVQLSDLSGVWPEPKRACLVWFSNQDLPRSIFSVDELQSITTMELIARLEDGEIYKVAPK